MLGEKESEAKVYRERTQIGQMAGATAGRPIQNECAQGSDPGFAPVASLARALRGHGLPSRNELQTRLQKLREEAALVQVCLDQWTEETETTLRLTSALRLLGYQV